MKDSDLPAGPLTQFQGVTADKAGTLDLVKAINGALKDNALQSDHIETAFNKWWPDFEEKLNALPEEDDLVVSAPTEHDKIEELLTTVRRIDRNVASPQSQKTDRRKKAAEESLDLELRTLASGVKKLIKEGQSVEEIWRSLVGLGLSDSTVHQAIRTGLDLHNAETSDASGGFATSTESSSSASGSSSISSISPSE